MTIANEEVFGPVLSVIIWSDEEAMLQQANRVECGLTVAIFTKDPGRAHHAAGRVQSGIGREESIEELLSFTQSKNINITP